MKPTPLNPYLNLRVQRRGQQVPTTLQLSQVVRQNPPNRLRVGSRQTSPSRDRCARAPSLGGADEVDEIAVDAQVVGDLGMKRGRHDVLVPHGDDL